MRKKNRDFDRVEMGKGGNVQQLILALVNGDRD
jgi:predicted secreted Zn-dependent protease